MREFERETYGKDQGYVWFIRDIAYGPSGVPKYGIYSPDGESDFTIREDTSPHATWLTEKSVCGPFRTLKDAQVAYMFLI